MLFSEHCAASPQWSEFQVVADLPVAKYVSLALEVEQTRVSDTRCLKNSVLRRNGQTTINLTNTKLVIKDELNSYTAQCS